MVIPFPPWSSFLSALSRERLNFCHLSMGLPLNLTDIGWCAETQSPWQLSATGDCVTFVSATLRDLYLPLKDPVEMMDICSHCTSPSFQAHPSPCVQKQGVCVSRVPLSITQDRGSLWGACPGPYLSPTKWLWCWSCSIYCVSKNIPLWTCWAGCQIHWTLLIGILALNSKVLGLYLPFQCLINSVWCFIQASDL